MAIRLLKSGVDQTMSDMKKNLQELGTLQQEKLNRQESYDAMQTYKDQMNQYSQKQRQFNAAVQYGQNLPEDQRPAYMRELNKRMYNAPMGQVPNFNDMMAGQWKPPAVTTPDATTGTIPAPEGTTPAPNPAPVGNPEFAPVQRTAGDWGKVAGSYLQNDPDAWNPETQDALRQANPGATDLKTMIEKMTGVYRK